MGKVPARIEVALEGEVITPLQSKSLKERRRQLQEISRIRRTEGKAAAQRAMYRFGFPEPPGGFAA